MATNNNDWSPSLYLKFGDERTQPAADLAARVAAHIPPENPARIIDIGCGPGNSTAVLKRRWPKASITGLDYSAAMLETAWQSDSEINWIQQDITGDLSHLGLFDVVFSNAALQWVPALPSVLPRLFAQVAEGGVLAVQVPDAEKLPSHIEKQRLMAEAQWKPYFEKNIHEAVYHPYTYFYNILSPLTKKLFIWQTDYIQVMRCAADIAEWNKGTSLRPLLGALPDDKLRRQFMAEYADAMARVYAPERNGSVLYPFTRIFMLACRD